MTLVDAYEAKYFPIPEPDDLLQVSEFFMESRGLNRSDLIAYLGSKERVSEVLNRKRRLSLLMIQRLHAGLGIPADFFDWQARSHRNIYRQIANRVACTGTPFRTPEGA